MNLARIKSLVLLLLLLLHHKHVLLFAKHRFLLLLHLLLLPLEVFPVVLLLHLLVRVDIAREAVLILFCLLKAASGLDETGRIKHLELCGKLSFLMGMFLSKTAINVLVFILEGLLVGIPG